jgi:hypothetical protein
MWPDASHQAPPFWTNQIRPRGCHHARCFAAQSRRWEGNVSGTVSARGAAQRSVEFPGSKQQRNNPVFSRRAVDSRAPFCHLTEKWPMSPGKPRRAHKRDIPAAKAVKKPVPNCPPSQRSRRSLVVALVCLAAALTVSTSLLPITNALSPSPRTSS